MTKAAMTAIGPEVTNGAATAIDMTKPYRVLVKIRGDSDLLFHRWNVESVEAKSKSAKGSKARKTDDVESYVYRNEKGEICIPGEMLRMAIVAASKFKQDPRSPRKSAMDLMKAALVNLTPMASLGIKEWHYEHKAKVNVQRAGLTRTRPAIKAGWEAEFVLMIALPEYVDRDMLAGLIVDAGRLCGLADFRPTYGRFHMTSFELLK